MNKNTILILDDSSENTSALTKMLLPYYKIYNSLNFKASMKHLSKVDIDLVIIEIDSVKKFNEVSEVLKILSKTSIPIIYTGEHIDKELELQLYRSGADDVILRPYYNELFIEKVRYFVKEKNYKDNIQKIIINKIDEIEKSRNTIVIAMSIMAESRDDATGQHIIRMQKVTSILANKYKELYPLELSYKDLDDIVLFAPLHDIGKVPIPDLVLKKPGKFSKDDMFIMKDHSIFGGEILKRTQEELDARYDFLRVAIEIATYHHEKFDGSGYPYGLKGEEIPLSARIVSLADVYDALISPRIYKEEYSHDLVVDIILNGDDRIKPEHFDPKVLNAFKQSIDELKTIY